MKFLVLVFALTLANAEASTVLHKIRTAEGGILTVTLEDEVKVSRTKEVTLPPVIGEVIQSARDLIAMGEELYVLVTKGRPTLTTTSAPISVLPREGDRAVNPMDMENWQKPVSRKLSMRYTFLGITVASLDYKIVYTYGGTYNGKGAYLTGLVIVPSASASFGVDFDATMKLVGIANQGSRANPVAAATIQLQYTMKTLGRATDRTDTFHITGRGSLNQL